MRYMGENRLPSLRHHPRAATPPNVAEVIRQRGNLIVALRRNLEKAQQRMRSAANKHRRHVEFNVGDRVLLKLQQYRQHSIAKPLSTKLARRFYGPFEVIERIGPVAYRLQLPPGSRIHNVFHVSLLRPFVDGSSISVEEFPTVFARGKVIARPTELVERRVVWRDGATVEEGLLKWGDDEGVTPTWESMSMIERRFPELLLVDKEVLNEGGVDTCRPLPPTVTAQLQQEKSHEEQVQAEGEEHPVFETVEPEQPRSAAQQTSGRPRRQVRPPDRFGEFVSL